MIPTPRISVVINIRLHGSQTTVKMDVRNKISLEFYIIKPLGDCKLDLTVVVEVTLQDYASYLLTECKIYSQWSSIGYWRTCQISA